jgi:hypothetical protein
LYYKPLEEGTFELPAPNGGSIFWPELTMIIEGIRSEKVEKRKRYLLAKSVDSLGLNPDFKRLFVVYL